MLIKLILLIILTLIKLTVPEKLENNINYKKHSTTNEEQLLETTTISNFSDYDYYEFINNNPIKVSNLSAYDCESKTCIVKCCPEGQLFMFNPPDNELPGCKNVSLYNVEDWKLKKNMGDPMLVFGLPPLIMNSSYICTNYISNDFHLYKDGIIYLYTQGEYFSQEFYCIDNLLEDGKIDEYAVICYIEGSSTYTRVADNLHTAAVGLSTVSVFVIVLVYMFTPHKLDLQKRCTLACCGSLFLGFFILLLNRTSVVNNIDSNGCLTLGILTQYFFLSFYFWLNLTCFEIFRIIRGTFNLQSISDLSQSFRRFFIYCGICYGCPLFICLVTLTMQMIPLTSFPSWMQLHLIKPNINEGRCWFSDGESEIVYYYIFEISLHVVNAFFMGYTFYLLYKEKLIVTFIRRDAPSITVRTHAAVNHLDEFKQQMRIYILYIFIWIINSASLIHRRAKFWRIVDIVVALQGVFVAFFILRTSRNILVNPLVEKISSAARELSSRIGERRKFASSHTETTEISLDSSDKMNRLGDKKC